MVSVEVEMFFPHVRRIIINLYDWICVCLTGKRLVIMDSASLVLSLFIFILRVAERWVLRDNVSFSWLLRRKNGCCRFNWDVSRFIHSCAR
jgi:hypothetical protein